MPEGPPCLRRKLWASACPGRAVRARSPAEGHRLLPKQLVLEVGGDGQVRAPWQWERLWQEKPTRQSPGTFAVADEKSSDVVPQKNSPSSFPTPEDRDCDVVGLRTSVASTRPGWCRTVPGEGWTENRPLAPAGLAGRTLGRRRRCPRCAPALLGPPPVSAGPGGAAGTGGAWPVWLLLVLVRVFGCLF